MYNDAGAVRGRNKSKLHGNVSIAMAIYFTLESSFMPHVSVSI